MRGKIVCLSPQPVCESIREPWPSETQTQPFSTASWQSHLLLVMVIHCFGSRSDIKTPLSVGKLPHCYLSSSFVLLFTDKITCTRKITVDSFKEIILQKKNPIQASFLLVWSPEATPKGLDDLPDLSNERWWGELITRCSAKWDFKLALPNTETLNCLWLHAFHILVPPYSKCVRSPLLLPEISHGKRVPVPLYTVHIRKLNCTAVGLTCSHAVQIFRTRPDTFFTCTLGSTARFATRSISCSLGDF